jgi:hypothetical protein
MRGHVMGNRAWVVFWGLFAGVVCVHAGSGFHIFTDQQGRSVAAKVFHLDIQRGLAEGLSHHGERRNLCPRVLRTGRRDETPGLEGACAKAATRERRRVREKEKR